MGYQVVWELDSFDNSAEPDFLCSVIDSLCMGLVEVNLYWLSRRPDTPSIYNSGVYYRPENGIEQFFDIPRILRQGYADCEDLASWRSAELLMQGIESFPVTSYQMNDITGDVLFHVQVWTPYGIEDPSAILGMTDENMVSGIGFCQI